MLLCRDEEKQLPAVQVVNALPLNQNESDNSSMSGDCHSVSVFQRLQRAGPLSLSKSAFETAALRARDEATACTFTPDVNHTHDAVLQRWSAGASVFRRLYGHAQCQREERAQRRQCRAREAAAENEAFHQRFRTFAFPTHLYPSPNSPQRNSAPSTTQKSIPRYAREQCTQQGSCGALHKSSHRHTAIFSPLGVTASTSSRRHGFYDAGTNYCEHDAASPSAVLSPAAAQKAETLLKRMRIARSNSL